MRRRHELTATSANTITPRSITALVDDDVQATLTFENTSAHQGTVTGGRGWVKGRTVYITFTAFPFSCAPDGATLELTSAEYGTAKLYVSFNTPVLAGDTLTITSDKLNNALFERPNPFTCMWCAEPFQDVMTLERHEAECW